MSRRGSAPTTTRVVVGNKQGRGRGVGNRVVPGRSPYSEATISDNLPGAVLFHAMQRMCTAAEAAGGGKGARGAAFSPGADLRVRLLFILSYYACRWWRDGGIPADGTHTHKSSGM